MIRKRRNQKEFSLQNHGGEKLNWQLGTYTKKTHRKPRFLLASDIFQESYEVRKQVHLTIRFHLLTMCNKNSLFDQRIHNVSKSHGQINCTLYALYHLKCFHCFSPQDLNLYLIYLNSTNQDKTLGQSTSII